MKAHFGDMSRDWKIMLEYVVQRCDRRVRSTVHWFGVGIENRLFSTFLVSL